MIAAAVLEPRAVGAEVIRDGRGFEAPVACYGMASIKWILISVGCLSTGAALAYWTELGGSSDRADRALKIPMAPVAAKTAEASSVPPGPPESEREPDNSVSRATPGPTHVDPPPMAGTAAASASPLELPRIEGFRLNSRALEDDYPVELPDFARIRDAPSETTSAGPTAEQRQSIMDAVLLGLPGTTPASEPEAKYDPSGGAKDAETAGIAARFRGGPGMIGR